MEGDVESVWHLFVIRHPDRDGLQRKLSQAGVGSIVHYPIPPHLQVAYANMKIPEGSFPISERIHREVLSLPMHPHLGVDEVRTVASICRSE